MERLIKSQYWTLVWIAAACLGLMILILPRLPDYSCPLPLWLIILSEWLFAFFVLVTMQFRTLRQSLSNIRIEPACLSLAIMFFISAIAVIFSPIAQLDANWAVSIGAGQLIAMSLGILASVVTIESIHNRGKDEEISRALELQRITSTRLRRPNMPKTRPNRLGLILKKILAPVAKTPFGSLSTNKTGEASVTAENLIPIEVDTAATSLPQHVSPDISKTDKKKPVQDLPAEIRRLPSVHQSKAANKIVDPNKRPSSTVTKLQALSASGIGSVHHLTAPVDAGNIAKPQPVEPLRSVLERLDAPEQRAAEELPAISTSSPRESNLPTEPAPPASLSPLFKQSIDKEMDDIFAKIAPVEAQQEVMPVSKNMDAAAPSTDESKLFQGKIDDQVEELFSEIVSPQAQRGVNEAIGQGTMPSRDISTSADMLAEQNAIAQELKDFGRLSARASAFPPSSAPVGTMKTIGKLLIDSHIVDNIIKKAEAGNIAANLPSARVISAVRGEGIQSLLDSIDNYHGVAGSMLVGGDGLVIASTYTAGGDRDSSGALAHGMLGNSNLVMLRLDLGKLEQMIFVSDLSENDSPQQVTTILTDVEVGALAVFVDAPLAIALEELLEQLNTIARG